MGWDIQPPRNHAVKDESCTRKDSCELITKNKVKRAHLWGWVDSDDADRTSSACALDSWKPPRNSADSWLTSTQNEIHNRNCIGFLPFPVSPVIPLIGASWNHLSHQPLAFELYQNLLWAITKNKVLIADQCLKPNALLNERSQTQNASYCMIPVI